MFISRLGIPEEGNKYYNTVSNGGYSTAIVGKPTQKGLNVLSNCVGYAAGRFNEIIGKDKFMYFNYPPNAEDFYDRAKEEGLQVGSTPQYGAIAVWRKGKTHNGTDGAGHVAVVECIKSDGSIITSESGYNANKPFWITHRYKEAGNWGMSTAYSFVGFIYLPKEDTSLYLTPTIYKGMRGQSVTWLQNELAKRGYLRYNEIDGDFQKITLGALLAYQFENGLEVDGVCGRKTKESFMKGNG